MDRGVLKDLVEKCVFGFYKRDIYPYFNDIETFLKFVIKNGGFEFITEFAKKHPHKFINNVPFGFWNILITLKPKESLKMISKIYFYDVLEMNGDYYYVFERYTSLAYFFDPNDVSIVTDIIKDKPLDPSIYRMYSQYVGHLEIIEELTFENKEVLAEYILKRVGGEELFLDDYQTQIFQNISFKQKDQNTLILTESNIIGVINDQNSIKFIIEKYIPELIDKFDEITKLAIKNLLYEDSFSFILDSLRDIFQGDIFEQGGVLHLKIKNFKKLLTDLPSQYQELEYFLNEKRFLWKYFNNFYSRIYIEDYIDLDVFDEINNIFQTSLI